MRAATVNKVVEIDGEQRRPRTNKGVPSPIAIKREIRLRDHVLPAVLIESVNRRHAAFPRRPKRVGAAYPVDSGLLIEMIAQNFPLRHEESAGECRKSPAICSKICSVKLQVCLGTHHPQANQPFPRKL